MASRSARERLLQYLEASQGLRMALETYKAQLRPAIWPQKSLPESRRMAPGMSPGHFFKARGRHVHEQNFNKHACLSIFHAFLMRPSFFLLFGSNHRRFVLQKKNVNIRIRMFWSGYTHLGQAELLRIGQDELLANPSDFASRLEAFTGVRPIFDLKKMHALRKKRDFSRTSTA